MSATRIVRRARIAVIVAGASILAGGCEGFPAHARVVRANYNVSRGDYQSAIVDYLRAGDDPRYEQWVAYNLGNVYHFIGEGDAALERWERALAASDADLLYGAHFNRGVLLYEQGRFIEARDAFRNALTVSPRSAAAKVNLELVLQRLEAESALENGRRGESTAEPAAAASADGGASRILDYVRRREEQRWRASREAHGRPGARDW